MAASTKTTLRNIPGGMFLVVASKAQPINVSAQAAPPRIAV